MNHATSALTLAPAALQLTSVSKDFVSQERIFTALSEINLSIQTGEFVAIVGRSGSGKSTLLNLMAGLDRPTQGEIFANQHAISGLSESELARWRGENIGIVFQFFQLIPTLTILENVLLAMSFGGKIALKERSKRALKLLADVGLAKHVNKFPAALSGGEQQRAAIARALANDPAILIADEPTGNLDHHTANQVNEILQQLAKSGKTVIVVTHDRERDNQYDRILTMQDGCLATELDSQGA